MLRLHHQGWKITTCYVTSAYWKSTSRIRKLKCSTDTEYIHIKWIVKIHPQWNLRKVRDKTFYVVSQRVPVLFCWSSWWMWFTMCVGVFKGNTIIWGRKRAILLSSLTILYFVCVHRLSSPTLAAFQAAYIRDLKLRFRGLYPTMLTKGKLYWFVGGISSQAFIKHVLSNPCYFPEI